jgi:rod shape determining protein RodA
MILFKRHDWYLNGAILFLAAASLVMLASISFRFFWLQLIWFGLGFLMIFFLTQADWRPFPNYRWAIFGLYFLSVILLVMTLIFAPVIRNSRSWLVFGPVQIQTAEAAKLGLIIILAAFFAKRYIGIAHTRNIIISFLYFLLPTVLILFQPDLGSALILSGIWLGFLLVSGIRWRHILIGVIGLIFLSLMSWNFFLRDYQKDRITALFNPEFDPLGSNYSVIQSKIAIGSAGFFGKGFKQGTQTQLGFLPESHSDFIFAAFTEEWGLLGGLLLIAAFALMIGRIIKIGLRFDNNFSKLLCLGTAIMLVLQAVINLGSNVGLLPVIGVSFPFFSYGGSNLLINAFLIGIIQSMKIRA